MKKYDIDDFSIKLMKEKEYEDKSSILKDEGIYQLKYKPICNNRIAKGKTREYYLENARCYNLQKENKRVVIQELNARFTHNPY